MVEACFPTLLIFCAGEKLAYMDHRVVMIAVVWTVHLKKIRRSLIRFDVADSIAHGLSHVDANLNDIAVVLLWTSISTHPVRLRGVIWSA